MPEGLADAIRGTAEDIGALLRGAGDTGAPVPGSRWTVGEAAAHLAQANELMADIAAGHERDHGDGTPQGLAAANERALAAFDERAAGPLATMIVEQAGAFLTTVDRGAARERAAHEPAARERAGQEPAGQEGAAKEPAGHEPAAQEMLNTPMGPMDGPALGSYLLTHMLGHGYDLARALDRPHMIDRARVPLTLPFLITALPRVVNPAATAGLTARYAIRLRGGGGFGATFTGGVLTAASPRPPSRPDCTILTEPVAFLLMALGRRGPWGAMARGGVFAWGRRPWLAPRFPMLFTAP
ncbi:maleylpyruvate isomerase family mycothiol-dependent enzyme [Streptomyces sp. NPDC007861]|uniref:maleylpyruvate isomerase family mycothiol-dependent enzyme n=1 Tax=Streptomyces sp. NPDC007861 TaxID=3154893 RepID=UPI0033C14A3B